MEALDRGGPVGCNHPTQKEEGGGRAQEPTVKKIQAGWVGRGGRMYFVKGGSGNPI